MVQFADPDDANGPKKNPFFSFLPLCLLICGHLSSLPIKINGKDLSSRKRILNFGLCFLI